MSTIDKIYTEHTSTEEKKYKAFCEDIIGDMLMGKYDADGKLRHLVPRVEDIISTFYSLSQQFKKKWKYDSSILRVYRGLNLAGKSNTEIIHAQIPFSTSIDEENAFNWSGGDCCILSIEFSSEIDFVCIDNPNEGREVVLPEGILLVERRDTSKKPTVLYCKFKQTKG